MEDDFKKTFEQFAAYQDVWKDTMSGMSKVWSEYSPENPPPEEFKKARQGMLDVMSESWEKFMRTPQFMELMRDTLNNSTTWKAYAKESANSIHDTLQTATKSDVEGVLLALRHVEKRMLDGMETLQTQVSSLVAKIDTLQDPPATQKKSVAATKKKKPRRPTQTNKRPKAKTSPKPARKAVKSATPSRASAAAKKTTRKK